MILTPLAALPVRDREILTMTAWEGLTPKQIAAVMGTSANIVRVRLHRARALLRRQLELERPVTRCSERVSAERE
jgi:RNA polymerase sigma-70 factor (ECF subfamily)